MEQCKGKKLHNTACGPHVFSISERAFVTLKKSGKSQCVVVSGESGSGKTETNKQLMNFLVYRGSAQGGVSDLTQKILDTNPILESFGNAKTTRNKNSSRFGRYVLVRFSDDYQVIGAQVRTFLLERSRVTAATNEGERAYHVLYQLVYDGTYIQPTTPSSHRYLSLSGCDSIEGVDDVEEFKENNKALSSVGLTPEECKAMWGMVAAMLHLGSISFGDGAQAATSDPATVAKIEGLLGVTGLGELLIKRSIKIGSEVTRIEHDPQQAGLARDALVKIMCATASTRHVVKPLRTRMARLIPHYRWYTLPQVRPAL
jgi:myosin heavy subunit